jgi:hypothetical protein
MREPSFAALYLPHRDLGRMTLLAFARAPTFTNHFFLLHRRFPIKKQSISNVGQHQGLDAVTGIRQL